MSCFELFNFSENPPVATVEYVDLQRYSEHVWYEIARTPFWLENGMKNVTAKYTILDDGSVEVDNSGIKTDGTLSRSVGNAVPDDSTNSKLSVTFFFPFTGEYWIVLLGLNYEYAVVTNSKRSNVWILSKTKAMNWELYSEIVQWLDRNYFDTTKLDLTVQE